MQSAKSLRNRLNAFISISIVVEAVKLSLFIFIFRIEFNGRETSFSKIIVSHSNVKFSVVILKHFILIAPAKLYLLV